MREVALDGLESDFRGQFGGATDGEEVVVSFRGIVFWQIIGSGSRYMDKAER